MQYFIQNRFVRAAYKAIFIIVFLMAGMSVVLAVKLLTFLFCPKWHVVTKYLSFIVGMDMKAGKLLGVKDSYGTDVQFSPNPPVVGRVRCPGVAKEPPDSRELKRSQSIAGWGEYYPDVDFD